MKTLVFNVTFIILLIFLPSGCENDNLAIREMASNSAISSESAAPSSAMAPASAPSQDKPDTYILSENKLEESRDLRGFTLLVRMTEGVYREEKEPGPFQGWQWEGKFLLELIDAQGKADSSLSLNDAFGETPLRFHKKFEIPFVDYNNDGALDFAIGQYASSNLYAYRLFTVKPDGIAPLPVRGVAELMSSDRSYAASFPMTSKDAFVVPVYDNATGKHREDRYEWRNGAFSFLQPDR
ncbi:hypothetical protein [Paenibacillus hamazuiensis]|uniref:hypothetical protein n=1 Tax=Paenibacillus hamazuiensis TaxID=2936508 RepID=UPI00200CB63E|nr:hypothetical protein [Paenibacillus hamazuiensis]